MSPETVTSADGPALSIGSAAESASPLEVVGEPALASAPVVPMAPYDLPDWTDPPTLQIPRVLRDLEQEAAIERGGPPPPPPGGPVWRELQEDWDDTDAILADLAGAGLRVTDYEESSSDDPFAYDFLDLDDDISWVNPPGVPVALGDSQSAELPAQAAEPVSPPIVTPGESREQAAGLGAPTPAGGPDETTTAPIARRHRRHAASRLRSGRPLRARRSPADPEEAHSRAEGDDAAGRREPSGEPAAKEAGPGTEAHGAAARNPVVATLTGLVLGGVLLACFWVGPPAVIAVVALAVTLAAAELFNSLRLAGYRPTTLIALLAVPGVTVAAYFRGPGAILLGGVLFIVLSMIWYLAGVTRRQPVANLSVSVLGFGWIGVLGAFGGLLVDPRIFPDRHGIALMLGAVIAAVGYDVGGYAVGSRLGRHNLVPRVSPNKSWEGLIGGCVVAVAASVGITSHIHPWRLDTALALGLIVAVVAPFGDLVESMIKRDLGVKDMGSLLPGHGGMLDRIDALLFVLPAAYYFVRLAHVG